MTIPEQPSTPGYAAIPNWLVREADVSIYAIAVYVALASRAGRGAIFPSHSTIAADARCSERKVREALGELRDLGVVSWNPRLNGKGRASNAYILHSDGPPAHGAGGGDGTTRQRSRHGVPHPPAPGAEEEEPLEETPEEELLIAGAIEVAAMPLADAFALAWSAWPRKASKASASKAFEKAAKRSRLTLADLVEAVQVHGTAYAGWTPSEQQYVPHLATWLNGDRWTDPLPEPRGAGGRDHRAEAVDTLELGRRLQAEQDAAERAQRAVTS